jgi:hypothetical protein
MLVNADLTATLPLILAFSREGRRDPASSPSTGED